MTELEFKILNELGDDKHQVLTIRELLNKDERTLLYGYTCSRKTFHVYLKNGKITVVKYNNNYTNGVENVYPENMKEIEITNNCDFVPDKRLYPEACDYEFCVLLKRRGVNLPFIAMNPERNIKKFYGFTLEDFRKDL